MQQILRLRLTTHFSGWSADAWGLVREAARLKPSDPSSFQAQVAATLMGIDARSVKKIRPPHRLCLSTPKADGCGWAGWVRS